MARYIYCYREIPLFGAEENVLVPDIRGGKVLRCVSLVSADL